MENVVDAPIPAARLQRDERVGLLDDADDPPVSRLVCANAAELPLGKVEADGTEANLLLDVEDAFGQPARILHGAPENVVRQPRRRLFPNAGKTRKLPDQTLYGKGVPGHGAPYIRPGIWSPPVIFPISDAAISWALRIPSFTAATTRS